MKLHAVEADIAIKQLYDAVAERCVTQHEKAMDELWGKTIDEIYDLLTGNHEMQEALEKAVEKAAYKAMGKDDDRIDD